MLLRRTKAGVPKEVKFGTGPEIALEMIKLAAAGPFPFRRVAWGDLYGQNGEFRDALQELRLMYVCEMSLQEERVD